MAETHIYTVNLRKAKAKSRNAQAARAMRMVQNHVRQHSKYDTLNVSNAVNNRIWANGASNPPKSLEIQVIEDSDTGVAHVELADRDFDLPEPEEPEPEVSGEDLSDEEIAEMTVDEVEDLVDQGAVEPQRALDIEYAGKNRKTLIEWLETQLEEPDADVDEDVESTDEAGDADEDEDVDEDAADEETYDLPDDVVETFRDGSIDDGKDAAKNLGKAEFEKLLNFEEAHQNRKGMKKFLRSNMN